MLASLAIELYRQIVNLVKLFIPLIQMLNKDIEIGYEISTWVD